MLFQVLLDVMEGFPFLLDIKFWIETEGLEEVVEGYSGR